MRAPSSVLRSGIVLATLAGALLGTASFAAEVDDEYLYEVLSKAMAEFKAESVKEDASTKVLAEAYELLRERNELNRQVDILLLTHLDFVEEGRSDPLDSGECSGDSSEPGYENNGCGYPCVDASLDDCVRDMQATMTTECQRVARLQALCSGASGCDEIVNNIMQDEGYMGDMVGHCQDEADTREDANRRVCELEMNAQCGQ